MKRLTRPISLLLALLLFLSLPLCAHAEDSTEKDWYLETADALRGKLYELISFEGFAELYSPQEETLSLIDSWKTAMETTPKSVRGYSLPTAELLPQIMPDMENVPAVMTEKLERSLASLLVSQINSTKGVYFLAASSIPVLTEGYVMPEGFSPCIILYEYEEICAAVSFVQIGEGVVLATAQFAAPDLVSPDRIL